MSQNPHSDDEDDDAARARAWRALDGNTEGKMDVLQVDLRRCEFAVIDLAAESAVEFARIHGKLDAIDTTAKERDAALAKLLAWRVVGVISTLTTFGGGLWHIFKLVNSIP